MYEILKLAVTAFVLPPGGPILLVALGVLALGWNARVGRALALLGAVSMWLLSLPVVAGILVGALGGARPLDMAAARRADAIVILGGGVRAQAPEYGGDTLGRLTLERTRYGAYLARQTGLPVLVTGGSAEANVRAEAELMREALAAEYGVPVRWVDDRARNTRENAANSARLLNAAGKRSVVLVVHAFDVRRASAKFAAEGFAVVPAPVQVVNWERLAPGDFLPSAAAMQTSHLALYETLALLRDAVAS